MVREGTREGEWEKKDGGRHTGHLGCQFRGGHGQRGAALLVPQKDAGSILNQEEGNLFILLMSCPVQRS